MIQSNPLIAGNLSKDEIAALLNSIQACIGCTTHDGLKDVVTGLKNIIPFEYFTCVYSHMDENGLCEPYHVFNVDYPEEWVKLYMERKYHLIDPVVKENFSSFSVQYWADTYKTHQTDREFLAAAESFGLCSGYTSGIKNLCGTVGGLFSFAGRHVKKDDGVRAVIEVITPHLYQTIERIVCTDKLNNVSALSSREKEVLKWVTYGKTTWETGVIMGISERTVKFHVNNIMNKFNAVSRTHAVAIAAELGIVEIE